MLTIKRGNVYFMKESCVKNNTYFTVTKPIPLIVMREPMAGDSLNTVTVIPVMSSYTGPVYEMERKDVNGKITLSDEHQVIKYYAVPQLITTIPVNMLGRYIGALDDTELYDLNILMARAMFVPELRRPIEAKRLLSKGLVARVATKDDIVAETESPEQVVVRCTNKTLNKVAIPATTGVSNSTIPTDPRIAPRKNWMDPDIVYYIPKIAGFPKSWFRQDQLEKYASGFYIDRRYYDDNYGEYRTLEVLTNSERDKVQGYMSNSQLANVVELYEQLTYADRAFFVPWIPTNDLHSMLNTKVRTTMAEAFAIKRVCVIMYSKMTKEEYDERIKQLEDSIPFTFGSTREVVTESTNQNDTDNESDDKTDEYEDAEISQDAIDEALKSVRSYLTSKRIIMIPANKAADFLRVPKHIIKRNFIGKIGTFDTLYSEAVKRCKQM